MNLSFLIFLLISLFDGSASEFSKENLVEAKSFETICFVFVREVSHKFSSIFKVAAAKVAEKLLFFTTFQSDLLEPIFIFKFTVFSFQVLFDIGFA